MTLTTAIDQNTVTTEIPRDDDRYLTTVEIFEQLTTDEKLLLRDIGDKNYGINESELV